MTANQEGEARVVCIVTVELISVVAIPLATSYLCFVLLVP